MVKQYDYLIVGAGLFGVILLVKQRKEENVVWCLISENIVVEIFIAKILKVFMCINMEHIYFIQTIRKCGIM